MIQKTVYTVDYKKMVHHIMGEPRTALLSSDFTDDNAAKIYKDAELLAKCVGMERVHITEAINIAANMFKNPQEVADMFVEYTHNFEHIPGNILDIDKWLERNSKNRVYFGYFRDIKIPKNISYIQFSTKKVFTRKDGKTFVEYDGKTFIRQNGRDVLVA